jgi:hypothetical protein
MLRVALPPAPTQAQFLLSLLTQTSTAPSFPRLVERQSARKKTPSVQRTWERLPQVCFSSVRSLPSSTVAKADYVVLFVLI